MEFIGLLIAAAVGFWVYSDAAARGKSSGVACLWGIGTFLLLIVFLPLWLFVRPPMQRVGIVRCPGCGKDSDNAQFCPHCGTKRY